MVKIQQRIQRPKTKRGKRSLKEREPKLVENARSLLCIRGNKINNQLKSLLKDLHLIKSPYSIMYQRKNLDIYPFENTNQLEWFCQKSNCSLFAYVVHTKKRPNNMSATFVTEAFCVAVQSNMTKIYCFIWQPC